MNTSLIGHEVLVVGPDRCVEVILKLIPVLVTRKSIGTGDLLVAGK